MRDSLCNRDISMLMKTEAVPKCKKIRQTKIIDLGTLKVQLVDVS